MNLFRGFGRSGSIIIASIVLTVVIILWGPVSQTMASGHISVWWPVNNVTLAGIQPFKALLDGTSVQDYSMYWQVDNGQLNYMNTNNADAPHKEVAVDVANWKWQASGIYNINFVAKDSAGNTIAQEPRAIYVNKPIDTSLPVVVPAPVTVTQNVAPVIAPVVAVVNPVPAPAPAPVTTSAAATISVWWPIEGAVVSGTQPFKAVLDNRSVSTYRMYWNVDNGQLNLMDINNTDSPHMESSVNLSGWNWKGAGPYSVAFIAKDQNGNEISRKMVRISTGSVSAGTVSGTVGGSTSNTGGTITANVTPTSLPTTPVPVINPVVSNPTPTNTPVILASVNGNPLSGFSLYVDPNSNAKRQVQALQASRPQDAVQINKIAIQPVAKWFGDWNSNIYSDVKNYVDSASNAGQVAELVAYNIPERDCGSYSSGGANSASAYQAWIQGMAQGIGTRRAIVILEPDSLSMFSCLSSNDSAVRTGLLQSAVTTLKSLGHTSVYIDAGNSNWISAGDMSQRLKSAGIAQADGFALNVSNFYTTESSLSYGQSLSSLVGGKHFVVDTGRNGLGSNGGEWCNPAGRALGTRPTTVTGNSLADAFLWIKTPGESDGSCNGGPSAGVWWPDYALGLAQRAAY